MVKRLCLCHLNNSTDTEDIFQTVFLKYLLCDTQFASPEHEKAWFIRVTINACKDHQRRLFRHPTTPLELLAEEAAPVQEHREVLEAVLALPEKYRNVIYLHYYEGYTAGEIADILKCRENTVYSQLSRARDLLRSALGGEEID